MQGITGTVTIEVQGKSVIPAYGELTLRVGQAELKSPVGADGAFYFENVPPGSHTASLEYKADTCAVALKVPVSDRVVIEIGSLRCVAAARKDDQQ